MTREVLGEANLMFDTKLEVLCVWSLQRSEYLVMSASSVCF